MRVLVTGHKGYIGTVMTPMLLRGGPRGGGLRQRSLPALHLSRPAAPSPTCRRSRRTRATSSASDLEGFDAVIHLAALSNDPLGNLNPSITYEINHRASVRLAELAKKAGVQALPVRLLVQQLRPGRATTCSTRPAPLNPVTPYGAVQGRSPRASSPALADDELLRRPICAPPRPTACRRACASTSCSTTSSPGPSPPAAST